MRSLRALLAVYFLLMLQFSNAQIFTRRIENGSLQTRITTGLTSNPLLSVKSLAPSKGDILTALRTDSVEQQIGGYPLRSNVLTVHLNNSESTASYLNVNKVATLYNMKGERVSEITTKDQTIQMNVGEIVSGTYILHVISGQDSQTLTKTKVFICR